MELSPGRMAHRQGQMPHFGVALVTGRGAGLRGKLLTLLLAFGVVPVATSIVIGYWVSRSVMIDQALSALDLLTGTQALHIGTEIDRERLLLRTIAGQLPRGELLERETAAELGDRLVRGLPEDGLFDGLRVALGSGHVLASVGLGDSAPAWPREAPAAKWEMRSVVVHRAGERVLAYLLGVTLDPAVGAYLEGHVREQDFSRIFSMPEHLIRGAESVVVEQGARPVFAAHPHGTANVLRAMRGTAAGSGAAVVRTALVAKAPIGGTEWMVVSALPLEVALAPLARLRNAATVGAAVLVLLIIVIGVMAARSVTTPLRTLAAAAVRFGRQESHVPIPAHGDDEVAVVVRAFNTMAGQLEGSRRDLEALHNRDLERAHQLATVGELASGVAHEIRNPLTGVSGALDLAIRRLEPAGETRALLEEAKQQLNRIDGATTQLLRFARPPELRAIVCDANLIVERAGRLAAPKADASRVRLSVELSANPLPVRADPELMVQVLINLLLNAVDTSKPDDSVIMTLGQSGALVSIEVRDAGPGVPESDRAAIFRPFYTTKHQGTGLGLSISRQIVSRHDGTLQVDDTKGGGATFVVKLPLANQAGALE